MRQFHRAMEIFWLITTVLTLLLAIYISRTASVKDASLSFTMPAIALVIFLMRRHVRRRAERENNAKQS
ncbi:MAG: hypothetical protein ACE5DN_02995 [Flavobacteriales bacterium]